MDKDKSKDIQDTLEKGAISEIKKKALAGEKDESGMPYATIYKMLTGKTVKQNMSVGGLATKNYVNPVKIVDNRRNK
jgi:hypothetical protein